MNLIFFEFCYIFCNIIINSIITVCSSTGCTLTGDADTFRTLASVPAERTLLYCTTVTPVLPMIKKSGTETCGSFCCIFIHKNYKLWFFYIPVSNLYWDDTSIWSKCYIELFLFIKKTFRNYKLVFKHFSMLSSSFCKKFSYRFLHFSTS